MFLIVCPLLFLTGFVDSIAGGGGLISLPAYVLAGLPIHMAIGTNKLSSACGTTLTTARFIRRGLVNWKLGVPGAAAALLGNGEALQIYGSVMNDDLSETLQAFLEKFMNGKALELYPNEIKHVDAVDWKAFPKALIVSDGKLLCDKIEEKITEIKGFWTLSCNLNKRKHSGGAGPWERRTGNPTKRKGFHRRQYRRDHLCPSQSL